MAEPGPICNIQVLKYWPEATAMRIGTLSMIGKMVAHSGESKKSAASYPIHEPGRTLIGRMI